MSITSISRILKVAVLWILFFWFWSEAIPQPNCYITSIVDKAHYGPVIAPFSVQLFQFFSYARGVLVNT